MFIYIIYKCGSGPLKTAGLWNAHKINSHYRKTKDLLELAVRWQHIGKGTVYSSVSQPL